MTFNPSELHHTKHHSQHNTKTIRQRNTVSKSNKEGFTFDVHNILPSTSRCRQHCTDINQTKAKPDSVFKQSQKSTWGTIVSYDKHALFLLTIWDWRH